MGAALCPCYDLHVPPMHQPATSTAVRQAPRVTKPTSGAQSVPGAQKQGVPRQLQSAGTPSFRYAGDSSSQLAAFQRKYELLNVLGVGSTSQVRRCRDRGSGNEFACKIIDKRKITNKFSPLLEQFENEIEVLMKLQQVEQHPNIIQLEDVYITDTTIYMVMELMKGGELFEYVVQRGTLSEAEASSMIRKITSAVALMHTQNVIHRDLKPENLLLTKSGPGAEIKIIDFGLSKMLPDTTITTHSFLGTRGYLAPEMLQRQAYSKSVDVWALGVIAFILLCGCLPFDDSSARITDDKVVQAKFALRFPNWAQNISPEAKDFLRQLLKPDPGKRVTVHQAMDHPWLQETTESPDNKRKMLASPKHIRNVPRTPKRQPPRNGGGGGGSGGIGGLVQQGNGQRQGGVGGGGMVETAAVRARDGGALAGGSKRRMGAEAPF